MSIEELLQVVEQNLLGRQLNPLERLVLRQSWSQQTYSEMARQAAYGSAHIKEIGSQLWHDLSEVLGERVTKKNLYIVLNQYGHKHLAQSQTLTAPELRTDTVSTNTLSSSVIQTELVFPSSPVPLNSALYINRPPIEELSYAEITQPGCVIRIKAPKKMGKSSLLTRILAHANNLEYKTVYLDFQEADQAVLSSLDRLLRWICANATRQLGLNPMLDEYWDEDMGSKVSCKIYFEGYLLPQIDCPIVLAFNEVNRIFEHPQIAQDFLPMLRFWHEQAQSVEAWEKLRLVVVHSTEIYIPLKLSQSPFNVGLSIKLPQFNLEQVQDLARRYGVNWSDVKEIEQLMSMVGGHPYLVNVAFYHLCRKEISFKNLLQAAPTSSGIYSHHLRGLLAVLRDEPQLISALQQVVNADGGVALEAIAAYKLESMRLVQLDGNYAKPSCELYRLYFRSQLVSKK
ncbi:AAA-like domain-containing protein [Planktothrix sp. FACHB-1355]|uniref:AAA-like domain-containing protein n=1 Tax=Aerosakkonema funiforme FACHB-1375 TaxID=2949571 RepID=A0A926ZJX6_9CYAN|nr:MULTISPECIES: AAA-like domain-containing protein [Oscillatoriales]MBD2185345.1 AAA-like domain-containing protein [Aerosakkonema funiforme FACHB-1375]MBD3560345.1 AAA-like domain-containing protein [Planktothrix sp. FACHB-1355]